jgi:hypothetical protein
MAMTEETSTSFNVRIHILEKRESEREKNREGGDLYRS